MAYTFNAATSQGNASGGALTVDAPAGTVNGHLLIAVSYLETDTNTWASVGSGFVEAAGQDNTGVTDIRIWWKIANSEPASWTWTPTTNNWRSVVVAGYAGATGTGSTRVDQTNTAQADAALFFDAPSVTTTAASDLLVAFCGDFAGVVFSYTSGPASAERVDFGGTTIYDALNQAQGATGATRISAGTTDYAGGHVAFFLDTGGLAAQKARPSADVTDGNWLNESASNTNLYQSIDEADTPTDTDWIQSGANPSADLVEVSLSSVTDPALSTGHILRYRTRLDAAVAGGAMSLVTELRQGTSALSTPVSDTIAPASTTETTNTVTLSGAQADAITDYSTLRLRSTATQAAPSAPTLVAVGTAAFTATLNATFAPGLPAGFAANDIHILLAMRGDNTAMTTLSGWTQIAALSGNNTAAQRVEVWWRRAVGGDTAPTITFGTAAIVRGGVIIGVRGCPTTGDPWDTNISFLANAASATVSFTNVSSTVNNTLVLALLAYEDDPTTLTNMGSFTQPTGAVNGSTLGNDMMLGIETRTVAAAGSVGASTLTVSGGTFANSVNVGIILPLKPNPSNNKARITWAELEVPGVAGGQDTPELYGHGSLSNEKLLQSLLAQ